MEEKIQNTTAKRTPWILFCAFAALAQIAIAGYSYGIANQSIQLTLLKHLIDPALFQNDALISTLAHYPSAFFMLLSKVISETSLIPAVYFVLHVLSTFGIACGICLLGKGIAGRWSVGMLAVLITTAGHLGGLAESNLYTVEFTHTRAAFALACLALGTYSCKRRVIALTALGLLFNVHPLMACYISLILGVWLLMDLKTLGLKRTILTGIPALALALPILLRILLDHQTLDSDWIRLVWIRSPHHVFPSSWWLPGNSQVPSFLVLTSAACMAASALSQSKQSSLRIRGMVAILLGLFTCGYIFTEVIPVPAVMRAQLFRSSRFMVLLSLILIAQWSVSEFHQVLEQRSGTFRLFLPLMMILTISLPPLAGLQPLMTAIMAIYLLWRSQLAWWAAAWAGITAIVCVIAWREIGFQLLAPPSAMLPDAGAKMGVTLIVFAILLNAVYAACGLKRIRALLILSAIMVITTYAYRLAHEDMQGSAESSWVDTQRQASSTTAKNSLILTPTLPGGFRIHSDRAIVGEWRDGTQQFFSAEFAAGWWEKMLAVRKGMMHDSTGKLLLSKGRDLNALSDSEIEELCTQFGATHFVCKSPDRDFRKACTNDTWSIYLAQRLPPPPPPPAPKDVSDEQKWAEQEKFMQETVYPNIEKHRKSDASLLVVDEEGRPLRGAKYELRQTSSSFLFGSAMPHFVKPEKRGQGGTSAVVNEEYLKRFKEIFNFSIIGYAGKWNSIESEKGSPWFDNLDKYVDWCDKNGITVEYHFVSGYPPKWMYEKSVDKKKHLMTHAQRLIDRYGDRIEYWQIVNERHLLNESPEVFRLFRDKLPEAKLGVSNCAQFWSKQQKPEKRLKYTVRGSSEMTWLKKKGIDLDFFGYHGHRPFGLWADVKDIYEGLDYCRDLGVRVHISEFGMHLPHEIVGPIRSGTWTAELQAEYYRRFFSICFSHPQVDGINFWGIGPKSWIRGGGLLDSNYKPKPAFFTLKKLITEDWRTNLDGTMPLDGRIRFRGFHGRYELSISGAEYGDGFSVPLEVEPDHGNSFRIEWKRGDNSYVITPIH